MRPLGRPSACVYLETSRQTHSLSIIWGLETDTQLLFPCEASRQTLSLCITLRPLERHSVCVCLETWRQTLILCVIWVLSVDAQICEPQRPLEGLSAPVSCEDSRLMLSSCGPMRPLARCSACACLETSRQMLGFCCPVRPLGRHSTPVEPWGL